VRDLTHPALLYLKASLFLVIGLLSATLLVLERPTLRIALLLALSVWSFARAYYFAFYVIERYIDPGYRFAGLIDFMRYLLRRNGKRNGGG
jgi:uncharacterized RDD family membrane protein YckC